MNNLKGLVINQPKKNFGILNGDFQAIQALPVSAVISDARISGSPIVYVNPGVITESGV